MTSADRGALDSALTLDISRANFRATIAHSYMRFRTQGVRPTDRLRDVVLDEPGRFEPAELDQIRTVYPAAGELDRFVSQDFELTVNALDSIGLDQFCLRPLEASWPEAFP